MPRRIGDVRLRYDAELLIGEKVPGLDAASLVPDGLVLAGAAAGALSLAMLTAPSLRPGSLWWTAGVAILAAAATVAGLRMGGLRRGRRGFVVNFDRHLLRVDRPKGLRLLSITTRVPFAEIEQVYLEESAAGHRALLVQAGGTSYLLVDEVRTGELGSLERLRDMLAAAVAGDPGSAVKGGEPPGDPGDLTSPPSGA